MQNLNNKLSVVQALDDLIKLNSSVEYVETILKSGRFVVIKDTKTEEVKILGEIDSFNYDYIEHMIAHNNYSRIGDSLIFSIVSPQFIFLFKFVQKEPSLVIYFGHLLERTTENRIELMNLQVKSIRERHSG